MEDLVEVKTFIATLSLLVGEPVGEESQVHSGVIGKSARDRRQTVHFVVTLRVWLVAHCEFGGSCPSQYILQPKSLKLKYFLDSLPRIRQSGVLFLLVGFKNIFANLPLFHYFLRQSYLESKPKSWKISSVCSERLHLKVLLIVGLLTMLASVVMFCSAECQFWFLGIFRTKSQNWLIPCLSLWSSLLLSRAFRHVTIVRNCPFM